MSVEVGKIVEGKITGIVKFGAFVDLGEGKSGLVHISEVSEKFIEDINQELSVGQEIKVKVISIADDGKIALSIRNAQPSSGSDASSNKDSKPNHPKGNKKFNSNNSAQRPNTKKPDSQKSNTFRPKGSGSGRGQDFDSLMNDFLKDSEDRLSSIKRNAEGKRGGRGGRRG